jgi:hypothetical protein
VKSSFGSCCSGLALSTLGAFCGEWVALANVNGAITGTCRSCDPQPTERYLAAYEWRFNCRFELNRNVELLASLPNRAQALSIDRRNQKRSGDAGVIRKIYRHSGSRIT